MLNAFKKALGRGLALAIPLAIVLYVFAKIVGVFTKIIAPVAHKIGVAHVLGELTLTIFAIILIILIILFLGLLMRIAVVATIREQVEDIILKFVPSLNQLKLLAADTLDLEDAETTWRPVLLYVKEKGKYSPAFVVEEDDDRVTLFVLFETAMQKGEVAVYDKDRITLTPLSFTQLHAANRAAGKGFLALIKAHQEK
ncbi:hypothetical protein [Mucilaginibacter jinjuensis]|uniref:DUF502 domain-containing protein n=1 Tax=Mucilaginibacter jinjuensis TaxID=1176721 RepID=A0ABY7TDV7_9SPHI|nr:hypothetical protein [Mucilaginibacter jinjuensis]WCT14690.1 hypothetical protein PQO05_12165 [Mucilaginibacter jinjuensis]